MNELSEGNDVRLVVHTVSQCLSVLVVRCQYLKVPNNKTLAKGVPLLVLQDCVHPGTAGRGYRPVGYLQNSCFNT